MLRHDATSIGLYRVILRDSCGQVRRVASLKSMLIIMGFHAAVSALSS